MKQVDPRHTEKWIHPEDPGFVVKCRAFAGVLYSQDMDIITRQYVDYGVVSVTDGDEKWKVPFGYEWSDIIPTEMQSPICTFVFNLTKMTQQETSDLSLPLGSVSTETPTIAPDASGDIGNA